MFNDDEKMLIHQVKNKIKSYVSSCILSPWSLEKNLDWNNVYLTGGAIASLIQGEAAKDYDFYFKDSLTMKRLEYELTQDDAVRFIEEAKSYYDTKIAGKMVTANSITMNNKASFITVIHGESKDVRKDFDFVHCMPWYDIASETLYISRNMFDAITKRKLIVNNLSNVKPWRVDKFMKRGYDASEVSAYN